MHCSSNFYKALPEASIKLAAAAPLLFSITPTALKLADGTQKPLNLNKKNELH
jgi:hypothetical protein